MIKNIYTLSFALLSLFISAQEILTLEDAIKIGLEKNYTLLIAKNNQEIAKTQNFYGAAGMSPTVTLNGSLNLSNVDSHQEFNTGAVQDKAGAKANNTAASLNADWTIFDGLKMFSVKKRLNETVQLSSFQLKQQMENTIFEIIVAYYDVVKTVELIKAAKQNLSIYSERKKIAKLKFEIGSDSKVDYLLSQSDENKAKSSILQLELQLITAKTKLNTLLSKPIDTDFLTTDSITINYNLGLDEFKKIALSSNSSLLISKQNEIISERLINEVRANNLPLIQLHGAYNFTRAQNQAGIVLLNRQVGLNGGITASWLLFNGSRNNHLEKERKLTFLNQKYITDQIKNNIDASVYNNYKVFLLNKQVVDLELQNLADAKEVQIVSLERYRVGKSNLLETIETQKNLEDAQIRYVNALYAIKIAETELLRTSGNLVK